MAMATINIKTVTSEKRRVRNVNGPASRTPTLAAINPLDHSNTKSTGMASESRMSADAEGEEFMCVKPVLTVASNLLGFTRGRNARYRSLPNQLG